MSSLIRCSRTNRDGSPCRRTRNRSLWWITEPWNCGNHRRRR